MEDLRVEQKFVVSWGKIMQLVPTQKLVEGVPYLCLSKWDRTSVRLLSGKALDLSKQKRYQGWSLHCSAWDVLMELRQQRANVLLQDALKGGRGKSSDQEGETCASTIQACSDAPSVDGGGLPWPKDEHTPRVQSIWVELTEQNILFLQEKCRGTEYKAERKTKKAKKPKKKQDDDDEDREGDGEGDVEEE
eukprot:s6213_g3.t1